MLMEDWESFCLFCLVFVFGEREVFLDDRQLLSMIFACCFCIAACFFGVFFVLF
jgi:hypothetical protein